MIELTDEMRAAMKRRMGLAPDADLDLWDEAAVEDVLAIVERDQAGPCQGELHMLVNGPAMVCELRHGHVGDHVCGVTRWRERSEPAAKWRCNTVERCFREDGHAGRHGFAGQEPRFTSPQPSGGPS